MARKHERVFSVGYERRNPGELLRLLTDRGVTKILDVRASPVSRKKGFSKKALAERFQGAGIAYRHLRAAGNPYRKQKTSVSACLRLYKRYLQRHPEVVTTLADEISDGPTAILCYERSHADCHRSVLLSALADAHRSLEVVRIE